MRKNKTMQGMIEKLFVKAEKEKSAFWKRIAKELNKPARRMRRVNLSKLSRVTKPNEWVIIPGKLLGTGELTHKLNVIALSFSKAAEEKVRAKGTLITLAEFLEKSTKPKGVRIIG